MRRVVLAVALTAFLMSAGCGSSDKSLNVFVASSMTEFWQRWHISLSAWLRDYVYRPLGGARRGLVRTCINLMLTMTLVGLWHGAQWPMPLWGLYFGIVLVIERLGRGPFYARWPRPLRIALTFLLIVSR